MLLTLVLQEHSELRVMKEKFRGQKVLNEKLWIKATLQANFHECKALMPALLNLH